MGFDVRSLAKASFPVALCPRCAAILPPNTLSLVPRDGCCRAQCPVCGQQWLLRNPKAGWRQLFHAASSWVQLEEPFEHARDLALAVDFFEEVNRCVPFHFLLDLLRLSQSFVHFATWSITDAMLGILAATAARVQVRGVVGAMDNRQQEVLETFASETNLHVVVYGDRSNWEGPHQKVLVIDGIVAAEGSANLTHTAWRKISERRENLRLVTDLDEVRELNNRYISSHWRTSVPRFQADELEVG